jgi:hypothetical protein
MWPSITSKQFWKSEKGRMRTMIKRWIAMIITVNLFTWLPLAAQDADFSGDVHRISMDKSADLLSSMQQAVEDHIGKYGGDRVWIGYNILVRAKFRSSHFHDGVGSRHSVSINGVSFGFEGDGISLEESDYKALLFLLRNIDGELELSDIRILNPERQYRFSKPLLWIDDIEVSKSVDMLEMMLFDRKFHRFQDDICSALVLHEGEKPLQILRRFILSSGDEDAREDALTLYGLALLPERFSEIKQLGSQLHEEELREELIFLYYLADNAEANNLLLRMAREEDEDISEEAVFWLGMLARKKIAAAMGIDPDQAEADDENNHELFLLYQMDSPRSREMLLRVAKSGKTYQMRKAALFWLCQDPADEVIDYLETLLAAR